MKRLLLSLAVVAIFAANTRADPLADAMYGLGMTPEWVAGQMLKQRAEEAAAIRAANQADQAAKGQLTEDLQKFHDLAVYACGRASGSSLLSGWSQTFVVEGGASGGDCSRKNIHLQVRPSVFGSTYQFVVDPSGKIKVEPAVRIHNAGGADIPIEEAVLLGETPVQEALKSAIAFWSGYVIPAR